MCNLVLCMHVLGKQKPLENLSTKQTLLKKQEQKTNRTGKFHTSNSVTSRRKERTKVVYNYSFFNLYLTKQICFTAIYD